MAMFWMPTASLVSCDFDKLPKIYIDYDHSLSQTAAVKDSRVTYNGSLLRCLDLCLEVRWRMKIAASLAVAPAFDEVHAHCDIVVGIDGHAIWWMSVATFGLCASADASLILATNLIKIL